MLGVPLQERAWFSSTYRHVQEAAIPSAFRSFTSGVYTRETPTDTVSPRRKHLGRIGTTCQK
jgi:hypothetical protein